jgi:hypothetical protein
MRQYVGDGWYIHHVTDRTIEFRKDSYEYRRFTGRDGTVRVRAEPGMDRAKIVERAIILAKRSDAELAQRVLERMVPGDPALRDYARTSRRLAQAFGTNEEPEIIGRKRV